MRESIALAMVLIAVSALPVRALVQTVPGGFEEIRRFVAAEADQAVAVDARFVYAIDNRAIGKYDKRTGQRLGGWTGPDDGPIIHLNSGIVIDGKLYCGHSNYPGVPMLSSIEIFDTETLEHVGSHSFGLLPGSATWIDRRDGVWWVGFANYADNGGVPGHGPSWTHIALFDVSWRQVGGYAFPASLIERFDRHSNSGAAFGPGGFLYATGHDAAEIYVLKPPTAGSVMELVAILPVAAEGQGFAWDPTEPTTLYTMLRSSNTIVVSRAK